MRTFLVPAVLLALAGPLSAGGPFRFPAGKHGAAELRYVRGVPVLTVAGSPGEIGSAVGALAVKPARRVLTYPRELLDENGAGGLWKTFVASGRGMVRQFPPDCREEMDAIVKAAGCDRDLIVAGNTFFDLKKVFACSALGLDKARSATGGPLLARNLDYPSLGYVHRYSLVTVYRPTGKKAFASVGFPGLVGVLSGINEDGLALGVLEVFETADGEPHFDPKGVPYAVCLRQVLERASTVDEAVKVLQGLRRTALINVAVADKNGPAMLEVSPTRVVKRPAVGGLCPTTNHFLSPAMRPAKLTNVTATVQRYGRLDAQRAGKAKLGPDDLRKLMDAVNLGELTLQTMVFEPATLRLHLGVGAVPASRVPLVRLDLADLLRPKTADRR